MTDEKNIRNGAGIVSRGEYYLREDRIHLEGFTGVYDPFEAYYEGETPHVEFLNLPLHPGAGDVLAFVNRWGMPMRDIFRLEPYAPSVEEIVTEARRMRNLAELLPLVQSPSHRQLAKLRDVLAQAPSQLRLLTVSPSVEGKIETLPRNELLKLGRQYFQLLLNKAISAARPVVRLIGPDDPHPHQWAAPSFLADDLLTCLYLMSFLDLTRNNPPRKCPRPNCSKFFRFNRKDQLYCSQHCAHAEAARAYRKRKKSKGGSKGHGRLSKRK